MDSHLSEQTAISADNHLCGQPSLCGRPSLSAVSSDSRVAKYGTTREKPGYASASINAALTTARSTAPEARPTSAKPTEEVVVGISLSGDLATLLAVMEAFHREQMELLAQTRVDVRRLEAVFHNELGHLVLTAHMPRCPEGAIDAQRHIVGSRVFVPDQIPDGGARRSMSRRAMFICVMAFRKALTRSLPVYGCLSTKSHPL